jgi:2'-5' RNA ligase
VSGAGGERLRLFVALDLPEDVRDYFARWRTPVLRQSDALRAVAPEGLHVTLCFLGATEAAEVTAIGAACKAALSPCAVGQLSVGAGVWLPPRRPRVLAVRLDDPSGGLTHAQATLSEALSRGGWYTPEKRPFLPHVTVARAAGRARLRPLELPPLPTRSFIAPAITLYRSRLARSGARYEALSSFSLLPAG